MTTEEKCKFIQQLGNQYITALEAVARIEGQLRMVISNPVEVGASADARAAHRAERSAAADKAMGEKKQEGAVLPEKNTAPISDTSATEAEADIFDPAAVKPKDNGVSFADAVPEAVPGASEKPKRTRQSKAAAAAPAPTPAPVAAPAPAPVAVPAPAPAAAPAEITAQFLRERLQLVMKTTTLDTAMGILRKYGAKKMVEEIPLPNYAAMLAEIEQVLASKGKK